MRRASMAIRPTIVRQSAGAVYVFTRTAGVWTQQAYLKASNAGGLFGYGLALAGDTLAVGAPFEASNATGVNGDQTDNSAPNAGAVYVFTRTAGVWTQQAYLKASNTDAGDRFGEDVVLDGDTLAVGARFEASNATGSMPIRPTIVRRTPERSMSSRGRPESGLSKPMSRPQTLEPIKISAEA